MYLGMYLSNYPPMLIKHIPIDLHHDGVSQLPKDGGTFNSPYEQCDQIG